MNNDIAFDPSNPCPRGSDPGINANIAIIEALGLNPRRLQRHATITLGDTGPVLECRIRLLDHNGHVFAKDGELATELRRYQLVLSEDEAAP
jgi:hypothetical protein